MLIGRVVNYYGKYQDYQKKKKDNFFANQLDGSIELKVPAQMTNAQIQDFLNKSLVGSRNICRQLRNVGNKCHR